MNYKLNYKFGYAGHPLGVDGIASVCDICMTTLEIRLHVGAVQLLRSAPGGGSAECDTL